MTSQSATNLEMRALQKSFEAQGKEVLRVLTCEGVTVVRWQDRESLEEGVTWIEGENKAHFVQKSVAQPAVNWWL